MRASSAAAVIGSVHFGKKANILQANVAWMDYVTVDWIEA